MGPAFWVLFTLVVLLVIAFIFIKITRSKKKLEPDYYTFFIVGVVWLPLGVFLKDVFFFTIGAVSLIVGFVNRDKWKKGCRWRDLSGKDKKRKVIMIIISVVVAFIVGILVVLTAGPTNI